MPPSIKGGRTIKKDSNLIYSYTPIGQSLPRTGSLLMRPFLRSSPRPAVSPLVLPSSFLPPLVPTSSGFPTGSSSSFSLNHHKIKTP